MSDDSIMYEPVLPIGTTLTVLDGPVEGSGFTWYKVTPLTFAGMGGPGYGWVAMAGKDGEAWIGPAEGPLAKLALSFSPIERAAADSAAAKAVANSINAFGVDLYRRLPSGENLVFAPASIALAFGLLRAGARGGTAEEIDRVFHTPGWEAFGSGLNALDQALTSHNASWKVGDETEALALRIANSAFTQQGWNVQPAYLDAIAKTFGAGMRRVDYAADPEAARQAINQWVSDRTERRIPQLLMPPDVTERTRFYLVNAIYLKGLWTSRFERGLTIDAPFTRLNGSAVSVRTMRQQTTLPYAAGPGWQATELLLQGAGTSAPLAMTFIRPDSLAAFESNLSGASLAAILQAVDAERGRGSLEAACPGPNPDGCPCHRYDTDLHLPRFGTETRAGLAPLLKELGMKETFTPGVADLGGIPADAGEQLFVSAVIHQANIKVDELGCEAAAATAIGGDTTGGCGGSQPLAVRTVRLDRPFLFILRDVGTGAILFMGRIEDPSVVRGP